MKTFVSYNNYKKVFDKVNIELLQRIDSSKKDFTIQLVGMERGGIIPLIMLDYFLKSKFSNIKIQRNYINISYYDAKVIEIDALRKVSKSNCDLTIVVDDLLDSGLTFETIYSNLQLENILYIFYYDKQNYSPNCKKILTKLKRDGKLIIGKKQKPENWLCFWYDFQEL